MATSEIFESHRPHVVFHARRRGKKHVVCAILTNRLSLPADEIQRAQQSQQEEEEEEPPRIEITHHESLS